IMQSLYLFFGVGTILSPLICLKYLSDINFVSSGTSDLEQLSVNITRYGQHGPHHPNYLFFLLKRHRRHRHRLLDSPSSDIEIPYMIVGGILVVTSIVNLISFVCIRYRPDRESTILKLKITEDS